MQFEVLEEASPPGADDVTAGLRAHVIEKTGTLPLIPLTLLMRDGDKRVRGGIRGTSPYAGYRSIISGSTRPCAGRAMAPAYWTWRRVLHASTVRSGCN
jgi:hypothetical protein